MEKQNIKKIVILAISLAIAAVLAYLDGLLSNVLMPLIPVIGPYLVGTKIGFANIMVLYVLKRFKFHESLIFVFAKSLLVGLVFGGLMNFTIGLCGTILSYFVMYLLKTVLITDKSMIFISSIGGFVHMLGQLIIVYIYYGINVSTTILVSSPFILIFGLLTGIIIGIIYYFLMKKLKLPKNDWKILLYDIININKQVIW